MGQQSSKNSQSNITGPQLDENEMHILMTNTHFTREQIQNYYKDFLHDCPNARLTKKDFVKFFKSLHPLENKKAKADTYCEYVFK
jgi:Ca2+-binding EF-hand superfamily protein